MYVVRLALLLALGVSYTCAIEDVVVDDEWGTEWDNAPDAVYGPGKHKYIEYHKGSGPIILLAPHGGNLVPKEMQSRIDGSLVKDASTRDTTRHIQKAIIQSFGFRPYVVINNLHRKKLDPNRPLEKATEGHQMAKRSYHLFHNSAKSARAAVQQAFGKGLVIEIHGQKHKDHWVELGYLLTKTDLRMADKKIAGLRSKSSIRSLGQSVKVSFADLLRGKSSLGALMEAQGYRCAPSPTTPKIREGHRYFSGGYDTRKYGSSLGGTVDAIQMELPFKARKNPAARTKLAAALVKALNQYFTTNYKMTLGKISTPIKTQQATQSSAKSTSSETKASSKTTTKNSSPKSESVSSHKVAADANSIVQKAEHAAQNLANSAKATAALTSSGVAEAASAAHSVVKKSAAPVMQKAKSKLTMTPGQLIQPAYE